MVVVGGRIQVSVSTRQIDRKIEKLAAAEEIIDRYADIVVQLAYGYARVKTGAMRNSIRKELTQAWQMRVTIGKGLPDKRARWNEYGTSTMSAQPMIRPAMEQVRTAFFADMQALIGSD